MTALSIQPTYPIFTDIDGQPLEDGYVWIGVANLAPIVNPITVYWDAALTIPAVQPIRTRGGYPMNSGTPARLYVNSDYSIQVQNKNGSVVYSAPEATERLSGVVIDGLTIPSTDVSFIQAGTGAVTRTAQSKMRESVSAFDYMTTAEIAAVQSYAYGVDMTATLQNAINQAFALQADLYIPAGGYLVTGLYLPGRVSGGTDDRGKAFVMQGAGCGEATVIATARGTVIKSVTDAPVLQDYLDTDPSSNGTVFIDGIRFVGASTTPVIKLQSFSGLSTVNNCVVYQTGTGDGVYIAWSALGTFDNIFTLNGDWATPVIGSSRTGTGFSYNTTSNAGLVTFNKCSARGYKTGFSVNGVALAIATTLNDCQCSTTYNGILNLNANKTKIIGCYMEGLDGGTGIQDTGDYTVIENNFINSGALIGIDASNTGAVGTVITKNLVNVAAVENAKAITINGGTGSSPKIVRDNYIISTAGTNGVIGLELNGTTPSITVDGNFFQPYAAWTGTSAYRIKDNLSGSPYGTIQVESGSKILTQIYAAVGLSYTGTQLTQANVAANVLTVPNGSYFEVNAGSAATVNSFSLSQATGPKLVTFRTLTANMTFADTARIQSSGAFTGPGSITFVIERIGALDYAYEISRTVY
jgi:hypothetical protein